MFFQVRRQAPYRRNDDLTGTGAPSTGLMQRISVDLPEPQKAHK